MGESYLDRGRKYRPNAETACTHDRGQVSPIQTDLDRSVKCLLYGKTRAIDRNSFNATGLN